DRRAAGGGRERGAGGAGRVSVLPVPDHRPLLRARHPGPLGHRAPGDHGDARLHGRLTRLHAGALSRRQLTLGAAVPRQDDVVPDRSRRLGGRSLRVEPRRRQHASVRARGDLRGRGRRGRRRGSRDRGEAQDHRAERHHDRARGRALLPVSDVHLARHRQRHLGPTIGAVITILLAEVLRIGFGTRAVGWDNLVYGVLLVLFIIFLPKGIV